MPSYKKCCTGYHHDVILGIIPSVEPDPPAQLYWYAMIENPNPGDNFENWLLNGDQLWLNESVMQGMGGGSAYWLSESGSNPEFALFWKVGESAPVGVNVTNSDSEPVTLTWNSISEQTCYRTDTPLADPNKTVLSIDSPYFQAGWVFPIGSALFDEPNFEVEMNAFLKAINGDQATFSITFNDGNVQINSNYAYINLQGILLFDFPTNENIILDQYTCP